MDPQPAPQAARPDVVRPLSRAAARTCARPGCPSPASATLTFRYDAREVRLHDLAETREPESYDLCAGHAERTGPPQRWSLDDRRREPAGGSAGELGGERTVALLAQMLGRDRDAPATVPEVEPAQVGLFDVGDGSDAVPGTARETTPDVAAPDDGSDVRARADAW